MRLHQHLRRQNGRQADDWLITYADTITLLLCLFVVILSIRTNGKALPRDLGAPVVPVSEQGDVFDGHSPFPPLAREDEAPPHMIVPPPIVVEPPRPAQVVTAPEPAPPPSAPTTTHPLSLGTGDVTLPGDRITTLQISSAAFFASGAAVLTGPGKEILRNVAVTLNSGEFASYKIAVEGHTDDTPINTVQFQSNWELSTARAAAVVRFFLEQGIPAARLTAAGYADTFPVAPNRNADGTVIPDNQAMNRRVVIRLEKIDKAG